MTIQIIHKYTRVEILLPCGKKKEKDAAKETIGFIRDDVIPSTHLFRYGGFTHSSINKPIFKGAWFHRRKGWIPDIHTILILVMYIPYKGQVETEIEYLYDEIMKIYDNWNAQQDEIWIAIHPISLGEKQKSKSAVI